MTPPRSSRSSGAASALKVWRCRLCPEKGYARNAVDALRELQAHANSCPPGHRVNAGPRLKPSGPAPPRRLA